MGLGKKVFVRKNGNQKGGRLYKWSPDTSSKKKVKEEVGVKYFCISPLGSQGNDYKTRYSYTVVVIKGQSERHSYVECDYWQ